MQKPSSRRYKVSLCAADMMMVGLVRGSAAGGRRALAPLAWQRAHFGAWCIISSPLILGFDLLDAKLLRAVWPVISNREVRPAYMP